MKKKSKTAKRAACIRAKSDGQHEDDWPLLASSDPEEIADRSEVWLLANGDGNVFCAELKAGLRIGGSGDALGKEDEQPDDQCQSGFSYDGVLTDVFTEFADRQVCVGAHRYPFNLDAASLTRRDDDVGVVYKFLLLLSHVDPVHEMSGYCGAKLFQQLCTAVARNFLVGLGRRSTGINFGFPRPDHSGFADALDDMCLQMGEGRGCDREIKAVGLQKDACLDVAAWADFPDRRVGRLSLFGQCAAGSNWRTKTTELRETGDWCAYWMRKRPLLLPIRAFFVPCRIPSKEWEKLVYEAGLLFDRCRITLLARGIDSTLLNSMDIWTKAALMVAQRRMNKP